MRHQSLTRAVLRLHSVRCLATSSQPPLPPPPPPRTVEPTTFASKSQPREIYHRPEYQRGMPDPTKVPRPQWEQLKRVRTTTAAQAGQGEEAFAGPSKPRMYYDRPGERELPKLSSRVPWFIALGLLGMGVWGAFILQATNAERLASSVLRQVNFQLRNSSDVRELLGDSIRLEPNWLGIGEPWISGSINMMQGRVDLSFRIIGTKGAGTVYFTSIRPQQEGAWRIVRYKVIADSGEVLRLEDKIERERIL